MAIELTPQGAVPAIGIPNSQDTARLVFSAPYFDTVPIAEIILPSVEEAVQAILPSLVPPYVDQAAQAAVQQSAVLLTGSTMSGPLNLSPLLPVSDSMAATKAYVDTMVSTAGVPEVPAVPVGQSWVRQTGQWAPLSDDPGGPFLQLSGGSMQGQINMSGNAITNLPAVPVFPNGAAPATWVLNQISAVSLYQGTWNLDTFTPDLTQPSTHINGYTWIAITANPAGKVISPAVPGLQGMTVFNGDTVIFSAAQGGFSAIHAGGLTAPQADARYLMLVGGQLSGALLLNANASQPLQAVTLQQLQAFVPPGIVPEAPGDGQLYGRNGLTKAWTAVLPLAGGVMSGALSLSGNASSNLHAVPFQQLNTAIATAVSGYVALTGATMTGLLVLSGNAGSNLNPVPLQQVNAMLGTYAPLASPAFTGTPTLPTGTVGVTQAVANNTTALATTAYVKSQGYVTGGPYLLTAGGTLTGSLLVTGTLRVQGAAAGLLFDQQDASQQWEWYAPAGSEARLWNSTTGDALVVNTAGSIIVNNNAAYRSKETGGTQVDLIKCTSGNQINIGDTAHIVNFTNHVIALVNNSQLLGNTGNAFSNVVAYAFTNASDVRDKAEIKTLPDCLDLVQAIEPKRYKFTNAPKDDSDRVHWGFIAQEVGDVMQTAGHDFGGHIVGEDDRQSQALSINDMVAVLWKAVRELAAQVSELQTRVPA